jgi:hypothetical protein
MYEYSERIKNNALEQIDVTQRRNERLEQQNKRYRETLETLRAWADSLDGPGPWDNYFISKTIDKALEGDPHESS